MMLARYKALRLIPYSPAIVRTVPDPTDMTGRLPHVQLPKELELIPIADANFVNFLRSASRAALLARPTLLTRASWSWMLNAFTRNFEGLPAGHSFSGL